MTWQVLLSGSNEIKSTYRRTFLKVKYKKAVKDIVLKAFRFEEMVVCCELAFSIN